MMLAPLPSRRLEASALLRIATPLMISYVADVLSMVIAKSAVGHLGHIELAATGLTTDIAFQFAFIIMGLLSVVGVLSSRALGAGERDQVTLPLVQGLCIAVLAGMGLNLAVWFMPEILTWLGQAPVIVETARPYATHMAFAMPASLCFAALRGFAAALMRTKMVMIITILSLVLEYVLMRGFVLGEYGFPVRGLSGAGDGFAITAWFRMLALAAYVAWLVRKEHLPWPHGARLSKILKLWPFLKLGLPVAGIVGLETGLFAAVSVMSGWLGAVELAAYQVVIAWVALPFVISLGLAEGAMVRVAYWMGAHSPQAARQAGHLAMLIGLGVPAVLVAIPIFQPDLVINLFLKVGDPSNVEVTTLVTKLLLIGAVFQMFDGLQAIASHALRGLQDAVIPLVIAACGYWVIGFWSAYWLAFHQGWGAQGLWWGVAIGLAFTGLFLALRFEFLSRQPR